MRFALMVQAPHITPVPKTLFLFALRRPSPFALPFPAGSGHSRNGGIKAPCGLRVLVVVNGGGVQIGDFLIEDALGGPDRPDFFQLFFKLLLR